MAEIIRIFEIPAANYRGTVTYDAVAGACTYSISSIEPADPRQDDMFEGPTDGLQQGDILVAESCLTDLNGQPTGASVKVVAKDFQPFAEQVITENAPLCVATDAGEVTGQVVSYNEAGGYVQIAVQTTHPPFSASTNNVDFVQGLLQVPAAPGTNGLIYLKDAANHRTTIPYSMPGDPPGDGGNGGGGVPSGEAIDTFTDNGETVQIYFLATRTPQLVAYQTPNAVPFPVPLNPTERGRAEDVFIKSVCRGTTKYSFYATLLTPYARLEAETDSTDCGFTPPACTLFFDAYGSQPTTSVGSATGSITVQIYTEASAPQTRIAQRLSSGQAGPFGAWQAVTSADATYTFSGLRAGRYFVEAKDENPLGCLIRTEISVAEFARAGCRDPAALNYDPLATEDGEACTFAPVLTTAIFSVPETNALQFVAPAEGYGVNGPFPTRYNTLIQQQGHIGVNQPGYYQKVARADVITIQFKSNFAAHTVQLRTPTGAVARSYTPTRIVQGQGNTATFSAYLRAHGTSTTQARVYFQNSILPVPFVLGNRITIAETDSSLDTTYSIVRVSEDATEGVPYLVIAAPFTQVTTDQRLDCTVTTTYDVQRFDTWQVALTFATVEAGCYSVLIAATDPVLGSARAVSEPLDVAAAHPGTLLLTYRNFDNAYGINYTHGIEHRLRFVGRLHEEEPATTKDILVTSDSRTLLLASTARLQARLQTFQLPPYLHTKLALAFAHDLVRIQGIQYVAEEAYERTPLEKFGLWNGSAVLTQVEWLTAGNSNDLGDLNAGEGFLIANEGLLKL